MTDTDPRCEKCGHPRSNHPYRHPFVGPSQLDTVEALAAKLAEVEAAMAASLQRENDTHVKLKEVAAEQDALRVCLKRWQETGCPDCQGDCTSANPPVASCIMQQTSEALK